jgi:PKD repeat protein
MKKRPLKTMKNRLPHFLFIFLVLFAQHSMAQKCATPQVEEINNIRHPEWKANRSRFEKKLQEHIHDQKLKQKRTTSGAAIYTIPVVVHVIHNVSNGSIGGKNISTQQILDQIAVLNEDYRRLNADSSDTPTLYKPVAADVQIEFCLAVRDPNGDPTNGIRRIYDPQSSFDAYNPSDEIYLKGLSYWPSDQYLNIWVCDLAAGVLGYAQFPSDVSDNQGPAATDGVVIDYSTFGRNIPTSNQYNLGRTTTHEVGHWLDLIHTWGDANDCTGDDFCADVPPCSNTYYSSKTNCFAPTQCSNVRMIQNYMDYSDDACMNLFTVDQKARMQSAMSVSPRRIAIQSSLGCCSNCYVPHVAFTASKTDIKISETTLFTDQSTGNINTYSWDFGSGASPATATGIGPHAVTYTTSGYKNVTLTLTGSYGNDAVTKNSYIHVVLSPPETDFSASKTSGVLENEVITFTDHSLGSIDGYAWDFGTDAVPATATGKGPHTVSYSTAGLKTVSLTTSSSAQSLSDTKTKTNYISVVSNEPSELHVYPNPAKDAVALAMSFQDPTKVHVLIFDRLGKKVFDHENIETTVYNEIIDVKAWADGLYIIKVITGDSNVSTWRMLVLK